MLGGDGFGIVKSPLTAILASWLSGTALFTVVLRHSQEKREGKQMRTPLSLDYSKLWTFQLSRLLEQFGRWVTCRINLDINFTEFGTTRC